MRSPDRNQHIKRCSASQSSGGDGGKMKDKYSDGFERLDLLQKELLKELGDTYRRMARACDEGIDARLPYKEVFESLEENRTLLEKIGSTYFERIARQTSSFMNMVLCDSEQDEQELEHLLGQYDLQKH
jgi:hypothetical protein